MLEPVPFLSLRRASTELGEEIRAAIERVVSSGQYIGGAEVEAFESEFAAYVGSKHCVGVANGLDAIVLALLASGLRRGDEVLVPSNTFVATWLGVSHAGGVPVPVEPDFRTHVVSAEGISAAISSRTTACIPVHLYGHPVDVGAMNAVCAERGVLLLEDAAQAHGATVGATRIGGFGTTATWSFYPGKNLGALGDAGAVTTDDSVLARRIRELRNYGSETKYVHDVIGYNSRLDPIQAAILRVKLSHLDEWNERRRRVASIYLRELADIEGLQLPVEQPGCRSSWHLFVVRTAQRDALRAQLESAGVGTLVHYPVPPHEQKAYAGSFGTNDLAKTSATSREVLSLPIGPHLSDIEIGRVVAATRTFFLGR